jgi:hypothetical protein
MFAPRRTPISCYGAPRVRLSKGNNSSIQPRLVFGRAGNSTKRRVTHLLRSLQRVGYGTVRIEIRDIPPFAKSAKGGAPRDLLYFSRTRNTGPSTSI